MSLALITVHGDYLPARVSFSFLPALGEVDKAVTPLFPDPRQQVAPSSALCVTLGDIASGQLTAAAEPKAI